MLLLPLSSVSTRTSFFSCEGTFQNMLMELSIKILLLCTFYGMRSNGSEVVFVRFQSFVTSLISLQFWIHYSFQLNLLSLPHKLYTSREISMLRCRPSEITLAPSDIAYSKHRFALQQAARGDRSTRVTDIQASTSPRIRRGPQRSRDDAVTHPHGRLAQQKKAGPSRLRSSNPVGNMDGAGEMCLSAIGSAASIEESPVDEGCYGLSVEKYDGTAENGLGKSTRNNEGCSYAFANPDPQVHNVDQDIAEGNVNGSTSEPPLLTIKERSSKSVDEKVVKKEDKSKHQNLRTDDSLFQISAEMPDRTVCSPRSVMTRPRSIKARPDYLIVTKRTPSPQINLSRLSSDMNNLESPKAEKEYYREYEQIKSYNTSMEANYQNEPTKSGGNPALTFTPTGSEGKNELGRDDRILVNGRRSHKIPSLNMNNFHSYSAHDLVSIRPRQRRTSSFKFYHNLNNSHGLDVYESALFQEEALGQSHRSNFITSYNKQCPLSSSSSRHSSYASMTHMHGPPQDIPDRRSSLDTTNVLNISCYGRSCSCSSPGLVGATTDNHPPLPKSPKMNRNQSRYYKRGSLPSAKNWVGFATRSSSISEAAPETVIHECSPLEQIQHYYTRVYRGCEGAVPSRWRFSISEPDQISRSNRHNKESQRLFSDPFPASDAFTSEEKREASTSKNPEYLSSPSEISIPKGAAQNLEESEGEGSNYKETSVSKRMPVSSKLGRPASVIGTGFHFQKEAQHHYSHERQHLSRLKSSSLPAEPSANLVRNRIISQVASTKAETETEHSPPTQISEDFVADSPNSEIDISSHSLGTNITNDGSHVSSIDADSNTSRAIQSLPWHLSDACLQQENRSDEDEQQMRMALQRMQLRAADNGHGERMDETPPREGRIERFLRA